MENHREGDLVGPYRLVRPLGRGATSEVWLAERQLVEELRTRVALKLFHVGRPQHRSLREARALAAIEHPNIVRLLDLGEDGSFLAMEFLDGVTLREVLADAARRGRPLPSGVVARIGEQVASALVAAHEAGITHRDLKPSNVVLTRTGAIKLLDFGIARAATEPGASGELHGTPEYMAPELTGAGAPSGPADVYALGVLLGELLADSSEGRPGLPRTELRAMAERCRALEPTTRPGARQARRQLRTLRRALGSGESDLQYLAHLTMGEPELWSERSLSEPEWVTYVDGLAGGGPREKPLALSRGGVRLVLRGSAGVLGSSTDPDVLTVQDPFVSDRHLAWRRLDAESLAVLDLGSKNGTWTDGRRLDVDEERTLCLGESVDLAGTGPWLLDAIDHDPRTRSRGRPTLRVEDRGRGIAAAAALVDGAEVLQLSGLRAQLLLLLDEQGVADEARGRSVERRGWLRRDAIDRRLWSQGEYDYMRLGRLLHDLRARLKTVGLPDPIEAREALAGNRAPRRDERVGELRLRLDGTWTYERR